MAQETSQTQSPTGRTIDCPVLVTERLVLRAPHEADLESMVALADNPRVAAMTASLPHPYGLDDARRFLSDCERLDTGCRYAITLAENGAFIGSGGIDPGSKGLRLGYWLGEPYWGKGYATEAAQALVELAFRATDIGTLHVACRPENTGSRRVIEKCGFHCTELDMTDTASSGRVAIERFTLSREDWLARMAAA